MIKKKVYRIVEKGSHGSTSNLVFDYVIMLLIIANAIAILLETFPNVRSTYGQFLHIFEVFSVVVFSIEYILRLYISDLTHPSTTKAKSILKFVFSTYGLIDLLAIVPFYLPFLIKIDLRFIRILRMMRFVRLFKINRYSSSLNLIWDVVKEKRSELAVTGFLAFLILLIASFLMFHIEGNVQPEKFPNLLASFWWAISTLTTVGYGDVYPITGVGKVIGAFISILGIGVVALPTGIIGSGFMEKIGNKKQDMECCPHCGKKMK